MPTAVLRPVAIGAHDGWSLGAGANKVAAVDPGDPVAHDDATSYVAVARTSAVKQSMKLSARPEMASITNVSVFCRAFSFNNPNAAQAINFFARIGGVDQAAVALAGFSGWVTNSGTLPGPGGSAWSVGNVLDTSLELCWNVDPWEPSDPGEMWLSTAYVLLTYDVSSDVVAQARDVASRSVFMDSRLQERVVLQLLPESMDLDVNDVFGLTHYDSPDIGESMVGRRVGWGIREEERALLRKLEEEIDPETYMVTTPAREIRNQLVTYYRSGRFIRSASQQREGELVISPQLDQFLRDSVAWQMNPGDGLVYEVGKDAMKIDLQGLSFENEVAGHLGRTCAISGTTGVTHTGSGTLTAPSSPPEPLWDPTITTQAFLLTAASPHSSDSVNKWTTLDTLGAGVYMTVACDHRDDSGAVLVLRVKRLFDNNWWDATNKTWGAGSVDNALPVRTTRARDFFGQIPVGANASAFEVYAVQLSGGTAGRLNYVYQIDLTDQAWDGTRIPVDASIRTRKADQLKVRNNNTAPRVLYVHRGNVRLKVIALWSTSDRAAGPSGYRKAALWTMRYDANNRMRLLYDSEAAELQCEMVAGGSAVTASKSWTVSPNVEYRVGCRWASTKGEWGLPAGRMSVFVDGVKGTDATRAGIPTEVATCDLELGQDATLSIQSRWGGFMTDVRFESHVRTDAEMADTDW